MDVIWAAWDHARLWRDLQPPQDHASARHTAIDSRTRAVAWFALGVGVRVPHEVSMAGSVNKIILVGNLGADPEIRHTQDGKPIANLSLATSESWKTKDGERREKTEWHRVVIFNEGLAKIAQQYLRKGSKIYIEGSIQTRKWQDKSGTDKYTTEVVLQGFNSVLTMLDSASKSEAGQSDYDDSPAPAATATRGNYANKQLADPNDPSDPGNYGLADDKVPF